MKAGSSEGRRPIGRSRDRWQDTVLEKCRSASDMVLDGGNKGHRSVEGGYRGGHAPKNVPKLHTRRRRHRGVLCDMTLC